METRYLGTRVQRLEDPRLISGAGQYVDDLRLDGMLHAAFARSPFAHARVGRVDIESVKDMPGVVAVFSWAELGEAASKPLKARDPSARQIKAPYPLAKGSVHYVGETVALVIAKTRHQAEDAAAVIDIDYEPLDAVADFRTALEPGAPKAHEDIEDNLIAHLETKFGDVDGVFERAPHVFRETMEMHRGGCHAMECRGVVCDPNGAGGMLNIWSSTQNPFGIKSNIADYIGRDPETIHVVAPDVGGGFGPKSPTYPEEYAVVMGALAVGRPVKWIEDRREHFMATNQQRDQIWDLEVAANTEGKLLAIRGRCLHDHGAYVSAGLTVPQSGLRTFPGPYALEALDVSVDVIFTNYVQVTPVRGSARPNICFVLERLVDRVARELGIDRAEVRRQSFIRKEQFPYKTGLMARGKEAMYDSGDYHGCLDMALEGFGDFKQRQDAARAEGRYIGLGIASYVEDTGRPFEGATVRVTDDGTIEVATGGGSQGQGLRSVLAQITGEVLGTPPEDIVVDIADTEKFAFGQGTVGSRTTVTAGSSTHLAAVEVREKALKAASEILGSGNKFLEIVAGAVRVVDAPDQTVTLAEIARHLAAAGDPLVATNTHKAGGQPYANGTNVCEVEVDIDTGEVEVLRYVVAHDCGRLIHPGMVDGQIRGGVVHGIGNALFERMVFDGSGNPVTANYGEYLLPVATEMPRIEIKHMETLSPLNPLGVKGAGEGGTIPAAACVVSAIEDALSPLGVAVTKHPLSPAEVLSLLADKQAGKAA